MAQDEEKRGQLNKWAEAAGRYELAGWERLPELELYMDQVITFMNRQLEPFATEGERLLTPSMINNYVKDGVLPRPEKKKYNRDHIAMLLMICTLKSVLSLPEIDALVHGLTEGRAVCDQYPEFARAHDQALREAAARLGDAAGADAAALYRLAAQLALEANARRAAAARILYSLADPEKEQEKAEKKDKEKKEKEREKEK